MAAHRYWKLAGIQTTGNDVLELSEARLYAAGVLADAGATLTSPVAPATGAVASLADGSAAAALSWPFTSYRCAGFGIVWDLGAAGAADVNGLRLGSGSASSKFPSQLMLLWSDDAVTWTVGFNVVGVAYPGNFTLTAVPPGPDLLPLQSPTPKAWTQSWKVDSARDWYFGGTGTISGTAKVKGSPADTPVHRRVVLIDERTRYTVREVWSDAATGNFAFTDVAKGVPYTVIAYDYLHANTAVIADNQLAV